MPRLNYTERLQNAIGKREDSSKILWFAKKVRPVYDFVKNFTPVANAASELSPVPFSAVLGGITCILSIGVKVDDYQAKMVETLDKMIFQLDLLKDYKSEALFERDAKVEASQVNVTTDILKFCVAAAKILFNEKGKPHNALLHLLKLQLKDFDATFGGIEAQFSRHIEELEDRRKFQDSLQLRRVYRVVDKIERDNEGDRMERKTAATGELEARERKDAEERHQRVLNWLHFVPFISIQDTTYCNRVDETGEWLLENLEFQNWRQGVESARLWIHGKAGSGKSFLAARVINDLKQYVASETAEVSAIAYAYCSSTKLSVELTYNGLLSSLLRQLYDHLSPNQDVKALEKRAQSSSEGVTRSELKEWIQAVIARLGSCFIIIDGLDECQFLGENEFEDMCGFIASLASPKDHTLGVKVIVFSRPNYSAISNALSTFTGIAIDKGANDGDMKLFITQKIDKIHLKQSQDHRRDQIKETIREQADGMFLWVDLRVKDLQHLYSAKKIQKALETASKGLESLYRESMKRIPKAAREQAYKALLWLANSHKSLSKSELLEALAVEDGETELTDEERLPTNIPLCTMCADLLIEEGDYFQLVHASLRDFLYYAMIYGSKEMAIWILEVYKENPDEIPACLQNCRVHLLAQAAEKNWEEVVTSLVNMGFDKDLHTRLHPQTAVHVASTSRAHRALKTLLDLGADPNVGSTSDTSPILSAAVAGDLDAVQLLLAAKVKVNTETRDVNGLSLLHHAVRCNSQLSLTVISELLDRGADVDLATSEKDGRYTPLCEAAWLGSAPLAEVLLRKGANLHHVTAAGTNPMIIALSRENWGALDVLIKHGADQAWVFDPTRGINLLHQALRLGDSDLVHSLLTHNKDMSFADGETDEGHTPFYLAMVWKLITPSLTLIENGATKYLKEWPEELPAGFFTQLHEQYQLHARPELYSPTLETLLLSLATKRPSLQLEEIEKLDGMSEVLEIDGPDPGRLGVARSSQEPSQVNIGQAIICELETIRNELLRLHQEIFSKGVVLRKAWAIIDACYFSRSTLKEPYDGAFIDGATYEKITPIEKEIFDIQNAPISAEVTTESVDSRLQDIGDVHATAHEDSIATNTTSPHTHPKESTVAANAGAKDEEPAAHNAEVKAPAEKRHE
ncbi:hypothetical protein CKAH01_04891 [Colletotrichum kahawae]|uniref:Nephrocystin 3-like N-terminal domain-containing protein n=1 Tax=Colletotrichum kahawae TaxID=34407 RepID=A0AAD9YFB2_COLKA|nr:hypothetical protein CKAH01_04891 [Colletotrichum kahawae]